MSKINKLKIFPFQLDNILIEKKDTYASLITLDAIQKESNANNTIEKVNDQEILTTGLQDSIILKSDFLRMVNQVLTNYELITDVDMTKIGIGTLFEAEIDGDIEEYMLVSTREGIKANTYESDISVSVESPIGKSVYGKKIGSNFSYRVSSTGRDSHEISGRIISIKENPFLKEKQKTL